MTNTNWPTHPAGTEEDLLYVIEILNNGIEIDPAEAEERYSEQRDDISEIAIQLLENLEEEDDGFRCSSARDELLKIEELSKKLYFALKGLNHRVTPLLSFALTPAGGVFNEEWENIRAAENLLVYEGLSGHPLDRLRDAAKQVREDLPQDRGGKAPFVAKMWGSARRTFVVDCSRQFSSGGRDPAEISAYDDGAFYRFVCAMWRYATAKDAEDTGLINTVKSIAPIARDLLKAEIARDDAGWKLRAISRCGSKDELDFAKEEFFKLDAKVNFLRGQLFEREPGIC